MSITDVPYRIIEGVQKNGTVNIMPEDTKKSYNRWVFSGNIPVLKEIESRGKQ